jgi:predicted DNA-binding transcriptional regulator AlpA
MPNDTPAKFLTAAQVKQRYPVSNMWLHRRVKAGDFPAPVRLNVSADPKQAMRYWRIDDLDEWDAKHDADA